MPHWLLQLHGLAHSRYSTDKATASGSASGVPAIAASWWSKTGEEAVYFSVHRAPPTVMVAKVCQASKKRNEKSQKVKSK